MNRFTAASGLLHQQLAVPQEFTEPFAFIVLADPQLGLFKRDASWTEERTLLEQAVEHVNRLKPAFVALVGDLTNCFPQPEGSNETQAQQVADLLTSLEKIDPSIPLVFCAGNHDLGSQVRAENLALYHSRFGDDYYEFYCRGIHGLVVNTQLFEDASLVPDVGEQHMRFVREKLAHVPTPPTLHRLIFGHIPPYIFKPDEPKGYFNLDPELRGSLLQLARQGGVRQWHCGHYHRNAGGVDPNGGMELIVTSAVGTTIDQSGLNPLGVESCGTFHCDTEHAGFRIVKVYRDRFEHAWHTLNDIPERIEF